MRQIVNPTVELTVNQNPPSKVVSVSRVYRPSGQVAITSEPGWRVLVAAEGALPVDGRRAHYTNLNSIIKIVFVHLMLRVGLYNQGF